MDQEYPSLKRMDKLTPNNNVISTEVLRLRSYAKRKTLGALKNPASLRVRGITRYSWRQFTFMNGMERIKQGRFKTDRPNFRRDLYFKTRKYLAKNYDMLAMEDI
ncbi:hypothetical protein, partial [Acidianus sp. RZ1]|uniref:hypothetical protein n=1 Tax=Acidianus sp. RZ1 TaxID=1540082 RepID=UPI001C0F8A37